jgi:hypothetical protein
MPPKKQMPAPIDRPLSRAYLREFKGWSTAYPPGVSDPTSLRQMENILINRDGAAQIRPGLEALVRHDIGATATVVGQAGTFVGTFEPFYLNDGRRAYMAMMRMADPDPNLRRVYPVVLLYGNSDGLEVYDITHPTIGFDIAGWGGGVYPNFNIDCTYVKFVQIDNKMLALANNGDPFMLFHVGATKKVVEVEELAWPLWGPSVPGGEASKPDVYVPTYLWVSGGDPDKPDIASTLAPDSLQSSDPAQNTYNFGFFYTYTNELGESNASDITLISLKRGFGQWSYAIPTSAGPTAASEPIPGTVTNARLATDHLIIGFNWTGATGLPLAVAQGATGVNVYMFTWSDQDSVPVEAMLIAQKPLTDASTPDNTWFDIDPSTLPLEKLKAVPNATNRYNSTGAVGAAQGIVAADRLVLVNDPDAAAVVRWTTNEQGNYLNFNPDVGGGYKTLTSGNMQIPACVKLWQNPQSVDTLTILCMGTDGESTSYYMAPASVSSQSDNTVIMGFEQTTATPGTVSPYGCEVANNALYHPLDDQLMKSTASNYNITHKSMTDQISNMWVRLRDKHKIVSCFHDQRLYFLVHNPDGEELEDECNGNEVWVLDLAAEGGTWSRWLTQGVSLRKIDWEGRVLLALVRPEGIYGFNEYLEADEHRSILGVITTTNIPWMLETNTQGANRAHDAWAHLQQVGLTVGNFTGRMRYGVRGRDLHGKDVEVAKVYRQHTHELTADGLPFDAEDMLKVGRGLKEWFFFAESVVYNSGPPLNEDQLTASRGQISLVQYRYTPISVNIGGEFGSVETLEYGRAELTTDSYTDNGIPQPYLDTRRP